MSNETNEQQGERWYAMREPNPFWRFAGMFAGMNKADWSVISQATGKPVITYVREAFAKQIVADHNARLDKRVDRKGTGHNHGESESCPITCPNNPYY